MFIRESDGTYRPALATEITAAAIANLNRQFRKGALLTSPTLVRDYLKLKIGSLEHEVFSVIYLNSENRVLSFETPFRGTINAASVYPREVVKRALVLNAAAVIFSHNHPSGASEPSQADIEVTDRLKSSLELIDVRVLDHLVVGETVTSFVERGWI
jgi:DNA repair protein RadC